MLRLRRVNRLCSRTISGTAYRFRHGSTLCSPTVEKILCRSPFRSGHMSAICARLSQKEVGVKRVETLVSTLLPRRGARRIPALRRAQLPAESQRKTLRPSGANTLTQFVCPSQPVQRKRLPPVRGEHACGSSCAPLSRCKKTKAAQTGAKSRRLLTVYPLYFPVWLDTISL